MKRCRPTKWTVILLLTATLQGLPARGQDKAVSAAPSEANTVTNAPTTNSTTSGDKSQSGQRAPEESVKLSPAAEHVVKLMQAGVSKPVIEAYIEQAPVTRPLSAADLIALKEREVPDDLTVALLKRAAAASASQQAVATSGPKPRRQSVAGALDPESYEFWWYHYAYPRALAAANETLLSPYRTFYQSPGGFYGYYPPLVFGPQPLRGMGPAR